MGWKLKGNSFDWLAKVPQTYTKRQVDFMTLGEAKKITERKFIKPADDKCFDAKVYEPGTFKPNETIADDYPVLVSEVVQWDMEYRAFVGTGGPYLQVKTWSNYLFHGQINEPKLHQMLPGNLRTLADWLDGALWKCRMHLGTVPSVIDVGVIPGQGWAIIETNQAWASGLYGCDAFEALTVMEEACERIS
jgi:hypothetical protein